MAKENTNKMEITKREKIKPFSPTPKDLRILKLSLLDQLAPDLYVPLVLFYPTSQQNPGETASQRSEHLRKTLSKALVHFYPFAGRLRNNLCIECNDDGVDFFEARAACLMSDFIQRPDMEVVNRLAPTRVEAPLGGRLLLVQVTIFGCGGIALGLSFSHKICDACSIGTFLRSWARIARNDEAEITKPEFGKAVDIFPPSMDLSKPEMPKLDLPQGKCLTRRHFFRPEKIAALKSKASGGGTKNPTRVEVVSGLIWKCVMEASRSNDPGFARKSLLCHLVNMRTKMVPALAPNVLGNFISVCYAVAEESERDIIGVEGLVVKLRRRIEEVKENCANSDYLGNIQRELEEYVKVVTSGDRIDVYSFTSWCRFGLYESDFGWEKPAWVSLVSFPFQNYVVLMDTSDGDGIEAWLTFSEEDMAAIETNKDFLAFASQL